MEDLKAVGNSRQPEENIRTAILCCQQVLGTITPGGNHSFDALKNNHCCQCVISSFLE